MVKIIHFNGRDFDVQRRGEGMPKLPSRSRVIYKAMEWGNPKRLGQVLSYRLGWSLDESYSKG